MRTIDEITEEIEYKKEIVAGCEIAKDYVGVSIARGNIDELEMELKSALVSDMPLDELKEMCDAKRDGRCVVLLPIDKNVFIVQDSEILTFKVYEYVLAGSNNKNTRYWAECISNTNEDDLDFWQDEIGQCVFLTPEEAEKALKGGASV